MAITDGRITWFPNDDQRLGIAVAQAAHFSNETVYTLFPHNVFDCLKDFERASGPTAGGGAH
jgi:hypothetical protein